MQDKQFLHSTSIDLEKTWAEWVLILLRLLLIIKQVINNKGNNIKKITNAKATKKYEVKTGSNAFDTIWDKKIGKNRKRREKEECF